MGSSWKNLGQKCVHTLDCVQALMAVGEAFPAVQTAQQAVSADPTWWEARQTLGRAQLNMGEVKMVMVFFLNTYHLLFVEFFIWYFLLFMFIVVVLVSSFSCWCVLVFVCESSCVHTFACESVCVYVQLHACVCVCACACVCVWVHVCMHACKCVYACVCVRVRVCVCMCMCVNLEEMIFNCELFHVNL